MQSPVYSVRSGLIECPEIGRDEVCDNAFRGEEAVLPCE
ncbi:hypothetical protein MPS_1699 [Mycobacterium pseudoshottsii JCM 15466]|nr:hypothetical protein MPS_1699 [Mycobacterium pseudoshottsii JCM 15466]